MRLKSNMQRSLLIKYLSNTQVIAQRYSLVNAQEVYKTNLVNGMEFRSITKLGYWMRISDVCLINSLNIELQTDADSLPTRWAQSSIVLWAHYQRGRLRVPRSVYRFHSHENAREQVSLLLRRLSTSTLSSTWLLRSTPDGQCRVSWAHIISPMLSRMEKTRWRLS